MKKTFGMIVIAISLLACSEKNAPVEQNNSVRNNAPKKEYRGRVPKEIAQIAALNFYAEQFNYKLSDFSVKKVDSIASPYGNTSIYIFNLSPNGFVLTSASLYNNPILAYSNESAFPALDENSPDGVKIWTMEAIACNNFILDEIITNETTQGIAPILISQWGNLIEKDIFTKLTMKWNMEKDIIVAFDCTQRVYYEHKKYGEYLTTHWGQESPYNHDVSPNVTGCVAVAMAQIMKFNQQPNTFNWSIMPNVATSYSQSGVPQIAALMHHIGINVNMQYGVSGSSANNSDAVSAFRNIYHYPNARLGSYDVSQIDLDLEVHRPVYVSGFYRGSDDALHGHAWVCDGYEKTISVYKDICNPKTCGADTWRYEMEFFHYNFGWAKPNGEHDCDAWYSTNIINYDGTRWDYDDYFHRDFPNYDLYRQCIYDLHP